MKSISRVVASTLVLAWATMVTGFYFKNHTDVFEPIHPDLGTLDIAQYFIVIVGLIALGSAGLKWLSKNYKKVGNCII